MSEHDNLSSTTHLAFSLKNGEVISRIASEAKLAAASNAAHAKLEADPDSWAMRSCWVCNPSHAHFLECLDDGFLFQCVMGCGHWYYQGVDLTGGEHSDD